MLFFLRCFEALKLKVTDFKYFVFIFENAGKPLLLVWLQGMGFDFF